jgi:hypothetical protein
LICFAGVALAWRLPATVLRALVIAFGVAFAMHRLL